MTISGVPLGRVVIPPGVVAPPAFAMSAALGRFVTPPGVVAPPALILGSSVTPPALGFESSVTPPVFGVPPPPPPPACETCPLPAVPSPGVPPPPSFVEVSVMFSLGINLSGSNTWGVFHEGAKDKALLRVPPNGSWGRIADTLIVGISGETFGRLVIPPVFGVPTRDPSVSPGASAKSRTKSFALVTVSVTLFVAVATNLSIAVLV